MRHILSEHWTSPGPTFGSHSQTDVIQPQYHDTLAPRTKSEAGGGGDNVSQSESLLDWIINRRRLSERDVRPLAQQLARTLSLMHAHGVVHRNLKLENLFFCVNTTASIFRKARRRAIITDFTFAAVTAPASDSLASSVTAPLMARCGQQYYPAPELLRCTHTAQSAPQVGVPAISGSYYAGPPVDVWGLGVVLYTLVCGRVPFDEPTLDVMHEASVRSPETLYFPRRLSRDCRDLLRHMLHADPAARASLDEVLNHPWTISSGFRCPRMLPVGADSGVLKLAALKWPDQVDRKEFYRIAALDSRNGDDAWRNLADTLELVSRLCEPCSGGDSRAHTLSLTSRLSRVRDLPDRAWSLLAKIRSRAVLNWSIVFWPSRKRRAKMVTS